MGNVRSTPMINGEVVEKKKGAIMAWNIDQAPLARENLDSIAPAIRIFGGFVFLAWSWVSTVIIVGTLLSATITGGAWGVGYSYLVAFGFALFVTIVEWVTEQYPIVHWPVILLLDAPFTAWQTHEWLMIIIEKQVKDSPDWAEIAVWIISIIGGIIAAKFGEALLLSKRK